MNTKQVTKYLRDALVSQRTQQIELTEKAMNVDFIDFVNGRVSIDVANELFKQKADIDKKNSKSKKNSGSEVDGDGVPEKETSLVNVIFAMQVINVKSENGVKMNSPIEDLSSTFLVPVSLEKTGELKIPSDGSLPWIPRDYLAPQIDNFLVVGEVKAIDHFIDCKAKEIKDILENGNWNSYVQFIEVYWQAVNNTQVNGDKIYNYVDGKQALFIDNHMYILLDETAKTTSHIKNLYEYALTEEKPYNALYKKVTSLNYHKDRPLIENQLVHMQNHRGQMSNEYSLSPSQRESVNHFLSTRHGEVLAVNGPPGTGKTTLLQSVIADMMVKHALIGKEAPVIVASSTNNQAVTNIIDSFAKATKSIHKNQLDNHWVVNKASFATYFPSGSKEYEAKAKKQQYTNYKMDHSVQELETESNITNSITNVLDHCTAIFNKKTCTLKECTKLLHKTLIEFDDGRIKMLELASKLTTSIDISSVPIDKEISRFTQLYEDGVEMNKLYNERIDAWNQFWKEKLLYRFFKFIPFVNRKLKEKFFAAKKEYETFTYDQFINAKIESAYHKIIEANLEQMNNYKIVLDIFDISKMYNQFDVNIFHTKKATFTLTLDTLNNLFDTNIRYYEFWLSVHYYECRWLEQEDVVKKENLKYTYESLMKKKYRRLSMITPCFVMTLFMVPQNFKIHPVGYMYDFIDLLIVDEAGQVSPEIGLASFLLAKKALVVGDIHQIEPVWNVSRSVDLALAIQHGIATKTSHTDLIEKGISSSGSSLMKSANKACAYSKYGNRGLLLTEHRRCYDELINYCNDLVYNGKLEPLRGYSTADNKYPFKGTSSLGHIHVETDVAERYASSRRNISEADAIKEWLDINYESIKQAYPTEKEDSLVGIITPFKAQANYLINVLRQYPLVDVGTVHAFQGGERKVILFSTVYGSNEGSPFIDAKPNLMNVAISRAEDRFIVVGDLGCLNNSRSKPTGLLREYIQQNQVKALRKKKEAYYANV